MSRAASLSAAPTELPTSPPSQAPRKVPRRGCRACRQRLHTASVQGSAKDPVLGRAIEHQPFRSGLFLIGRLTGGYAAKATENPTMSPVESMLGLLVRIGAPAPIN